MSVLKRLGYRQVLTASQRAAAKGLRLLVILAGLVLSGLLALRWLL